MLPTHAGSKSNNGLNGVFTFLGVMNKSVFASVIALLLSVSLFYMSYRHCSLYGDVSELTCNQNDCYVKSKSLGDYSFSREDFIRLEKVRCQKDGTIVPESEVRKKSSKEQRKLANTLQLEIKWSGSAGSKSMTTDRTTLFSTLDMGSRAVKIAETQFKRYMAKEGERSDELSVSVGK